MGIRDPFPIEVNACISNIKCRQMLINLISQLMRVKSKMKISQITRFRSLKGHADAEKEIKR